MGIRDQQKEQRKTALIQAGMHLFEQQGFPATTVDQVTVAAGLAKGTFYNYFTTKEDLLVAGMQAAQGGYAGYIESQLVQLTNVVERLQWVIRCACGWITAFPDLAMIWCQERLRRGIEATNSHFDELLAEVVTGGQATGELRTDRAAADMTLEIEGIFLAYVAAWYHGGMTTDLVGALDGALAGYVAGARHP